MSSYIPQCGMKNCKNKRDGQGRFGPYCWWHRTYDAAYIRSGGDAKMEALMRQSVGPLKVLRTHRGRKIWDPSAATTPAQAYANLYSSGYGMSGHVAKVLGWACHRMEHERDTCPEFVAANAERRFDQMGSLLVRAVNLNAQDPVRLRAEDIGVMHLGSPTIKAFSPHRFTRGRERRYDQVEHDVILVRDIDYHRSEGEEKVFAVDPNIAMLAPVGDRKADLDPELYPSGRTPFTEGVWVAPIEDYIRSPLIRWERYGESWQGQSR